MSIFFLMAGSVWEQRWTNVSMWCLIQITRVWGVGVFISTMSTALITSLPNQQQKVQTKSKSWIIDLLTALNPSITYLNAH